LQVTQVLALGDNFYHYGINGTCESVRFDQTWNDVYTAASLMVPWLVNAGNHDHRGNVSAQIAYTAISDRWIFPSLYHKRTIYSDDRSVTVDIILMDTTNYTGVNSGTDYPPTVQDPAQQQWLEESLKYSVADYIIVGSHYPMYSACEHGNTLTMLNNLKPLLEKYNAHLMSGHDHCAEHIVENGISYWLNGIGHGCW
jgi:tartrate-resistant acid phosphatase type 5